MAAIRLVIGAGYQNNVYQGRFRQVGNTRAGNEYEDAFTGLRRCSISD